jgi:hypothetical protein
VVDATGTTVDNEAELMAASARLSWPLARGYLAVSVQDLMAADTQPKRHGFLPWYIANSANDTDGHGALAPLALRPIGSP